VRGHGRTVGKLLIAEPMLGDPNFDRSVVLMVDHTAEGALGVVLNRPTDREVATVLGRWGDLAARPPVLYLGGPVEQDGVLALARRRAFGPRERLAGWSPVVGDVGTLDLQRDPDELAPDLAGVRFFAGYSGWGPGQLEAELGDGAWYVVESEPGDVSSPQPETLWRQVLRRQRGDLAMIATYPDDPSLN